MDTAPARPRGRADEQNTELCPVIGTGVNGRRIRSAERRDQPAPQNASITRQAIFERTPEGDAATASVVQLIPAPSRVDADALLPGTRSYSPASAARSALRTFGISKGIEARGGALDLDLGSVGRLALLAQTVTAASAVPSGARAAATSRPADRAPRIGNANAAAVHDALAPERGEPFEAFEDLDGRSDGAVLSNSSSGTARRRRRDRWRISSYVERHGIVLADDREHPSAAGSSCSRPWRSQVRTAAAVPRRPRASTARPWFDPSARRTASFSIRGPPCHRRAAASGTAWAPLGRTPRDEALASEQRRRPEQGVEVAVVSWSHPNRSSTSANRSANTSYSSADQPAPRPSSTAAGEPVDRRRRLRDDRRTAKSRRDTSVPSRTRS